MTQEMTRPSVNEALGGAEFAFVEMPLPDTGDNRSTASSGSRRGLGWAVLMMVVVALWPAAWGGLTGITIVNGQSMDSVYKTNDVVLTLRQSSYGVGDAISYKVPEGQDGAGTRVIHRVVAVDNSGAEPVFTSQGGNSSSVDPWTITTDDVAGKATLRVPGAAFGGLNGMLLGAVAASGCFVVVWPTRSRTSTSARKPVLVRSGL